MCFWSRFRIWFYSGFGFGPGFAFCVFGFGSGFGFIVDLVSVPDVVCGFLVSVPDLVSVQGRASHEAKAKHRNCEQRADAS